MFWNVIVKENPFDDSCYDDSLIFTFYDKKEAIKFIEYISDISYYSFELLQLEEKDEESE